MVKELEQIKPNLFIVGAPKSGTTFLYEKLKNHPEFFFPKIKELNYFSYDKLNRDSYYKEYKISSLDKYLEFYKHGKTQKYLVDASVSYFNNFDSHQKIFEFNKDAKIIIMYRDPIKRACSHYKMDLRMGYADLPFKDYLIKEQHPKHFIQYVENSMFGACLQNLQKYFDRRNIIIVNLNNLVADFKMMLNKLEIDSSNYDFTFEKVNENKSPANGIAKYLQHNRNLTSKLKLFMPKKFIAVFKKVSYKEAEKIVIDNEEVQLIEALVKSDRELFDKINVQ